MAPLVVTNGRTDGVTVLAELASAGWTLLEGFAPPTTAWDLTDDRVVCVGVVDTSETASAALLAGFRGAGLVMQLDLDPIARWRFMFDLRHVGNLSEDAARPSPRLEPEEEQLLRLLAAGASLTSAAHTLAMSRRTAHRRLATARRTLGAPTTAAAITILLTSFGPAAAPGL